MNIYCKFNNHHKDILVCKLICPRELYCREFQELCEKKDREIRWILYQYMQKYPDKDYHIYLLPKKEKGRIPQMKQFVCMREGQIQILSEEEIVERIKKGEFFQTYFEVGREMELLIKLAPKGGAVQNTAKKRTAPAPRKKVEDTGSEA